MAEIKAIETCYNGYRFRSRLEARWAVFFDSIGFEYEYEPEGFDLGDGYFYLPDFYLPTNNSWIEIKGKDPTDTDIEKITRFCESKCDVVNGGAKFRLLVGQIPKEPVIYEGHFGIPCFNFISTDEFNKYMRNKYERKIKRGQLMEAVWSPKCSTHDMITGLVAARQARFEHGERG